MGALRSAVCGGNVGDRTFAVDIAAPRERVFDLWVDVARLHEWTEGLTRVSDVTGAPGVVGTHWTAWFGRSRTSAEVIAAERPRLVAWRVRAWVIAAEIQAEFEATATGTRLTETVRTRGVVGWLWARILGTGSYRGSFRGELATFASICEADARQAG